jgi:SAM-dependent methyltransferase
MPRLLFQTPPPQTLFISTNSSTGRASDRRSVVVAREAVLFGVGLGMGTANALRHRVRGYVNPRPFSANDLERTIAHAIDVVERLEAHGEVNWVGKRVLEVGPGSDLSTGAVMIHRGASSYCAVDLFDNRNQADPALYSELSRALGSTIDPAKLDFCQTDFPALPDMHGQWDLIVSNATLEHIDGIPALFRRLAQLAAPGARMVHHVDAQTHMRWVKDVDPWNILRYPVPLYDRLLRFPGAPNRLLAGDYVRAAHSADWSATTVQEDLLADEDYLARARLARPFRSAGSDLRLLTFTLVASRDDRLGDSQAS